MSGYNRLVPFSRKENAVRYSIAGITLIVLLLFGVEFLKTAKNEDENRVLLPLAIGYVNCPAFVPNHSIFKVISNSPLTVKVEQNRTLVVGENCSVTLY
jgi:hypothetical protein